MKINRVSSVAWAVAGVLLLSVSAGYALKVGNNGLPAPDNLNVGDKYYLIFTTSTKTDATSADIADYDAFVNAAADLSTINGVSNTTWYALASTPTVDARDQLKGGDYPVYRLVPFTKVADNAADLWDGSIDAPGDGAHRGNLNYDENANPVRAASGEAVWTGTANDGTEYNNTDGLGTATPRRGQCNQSGSFWIGRAGDPNTDTRHLYAISEVLTVQGEYDTGDLKGQLDVLDLSGDYGKGMGINPITGEPWAARDAYRLIFVSSTAISGNQSTLAAYNTLVQNDADNATVFANDGVTWKAVVSHDNGVTVTDAADNVGAIGEVPIFDLDSYCWFYGEDDLWDANATPELPLVPPQNKDDRLIERQPDGGEYSSDEVWTGTSRSNGEASGSNPLGTGGNANGEYGESTRNWLQQGSTALTGTFPVYAISEELEIRSPGATLMVIE